MSITAFTAGQPGIYEDIPGEAYHAGPGISRTGLWKIHSRSPRHFRFGKQKDTDAFSLGEAAHLAILQPDAFETRVCRGPDDRRGNRWKDAQEAAELDGRMLLTAGDFDAVLEIRDAVHSDAWVSAILTGGDRQIEASGCWLDEETGVLCRCRPDLYRRDLKVIVDIKTTVSARSDDFAKSVVSYGYHAQEAFYSDGWRVLGQEVDAFVFIALEKEAPWAKAVYELPPSIVEEGRAIMRKTLPVFEECQRTNIWPGYPEGVQELQFPRWAYTLIMEGDPS